MAFSATARSRRVLATTRSTKSVISPPHAVRIVDETLSIIIRIVQADKCTGATGQQYLRVTEPNQAWVPSGRDINAQPSAVQRWRTWGQIL